MQKHTTNHESDAPLESIARTASASLTRSAVIYRFYLQSLARELLPSERVAQCLRALVPGKETVDLHKNIVTKRVFYKNLITCGSIWGCPVCASRISETRREELAAALASCTLHPVLITYTFSHSKRDKSRHLLDVLKNSYRRLKSGRAWQNLANDYAWVGSIRSVEPTYGQNGWHFHIHEIALLQIKLTAGQKIGFEKVLKQRWGHVLGVLGHSASWEHGVRADSRDSAISAYVAKFGNEPVRQNNWTLEHELTKSAIKKGRGDGRTMTQLLADYGEGDLQAGKLWREYFYVFKGSHQLVWSAGLRKLLGIGVEKPDAEAAADVPAAAPLFASLTPRQWRIILRADVRGELQEAASSMDIEQLAQWVVDVLDRYGHLER